MEKIVLTGGGTGGHIYPNLALVPELRRRNIIPIYIGSEGDSLERRAAERLKLAFFGIPCVKFVRSFGAQAIKNNLSIPAKLRRSIKSAEKILIEEQPSLIFAKGGFVSLPVTLAAAKLNIPVVCHESDLTAGIANRIAAKKGALALSAHPDSKFGQFVGMPLREEIFKTDRRSARRKFGLRDDERVLLIVGGSSGAQALNDAVSRRLKELTDNYTVIHITGKGKTAGSTDGKGRYLTLEYCVDMGAAYAAADVVVSRAGATAVAELSALGKKALFIPLPKGVSRGDQPYNAALAERYGAKVLLQEEGFETRLLSAIDAACSAPPMRRICDDSNGKIADIICAKMRRGEKCKNKKP